MIILLLIVLLFPSALYGQSRTTIATDNFNRVEDPLSNGGVWRKVSTTGVEGFEADGIVAIPDATDDGLFHHMIHTAALNDDQWSEVSCPTIGSGSYCGLLVRWAAFETNTGYLFIADASGNHEVLKRVAGSTTSLNTASAGVPEGATYRFHIIGSDLTIYRNDVSVLTGLDAAITSGSGGIMGHAVAEAKFDNFSVGNFTAAAAGAARRAIIVE